MEDTRTTPTQLAIEIIGGLTIVGGLVAVVADLALHILSAGYGNVVILCFTLMGFLLVRGIGILSNIQVMVSYLWIFMVATAGVFLPVVRHEQLPTWIMGQDPVGAQMVAVAMVLGLILNIKLYEKYDRRRPVWFDALASFVLLIPVILFVN